MPTYVYECIACASVWDTYKRVAEIDNEEPCPLCAKAGVRKIQAPQLDPKIGDWNRPEFNPALGKVTYGWRDARKKAKAMGLEEVGNETPDKIHKHHDQMREEKRAQAWADADKVKLYE